MDGGEARGGQDQDAHDGEGLEQDQRMVLCASQPANAASLARSRQIEHACALARQAIDHAATVASFRTAHRIVLMLAELQLDLDQPEVQAVTEYARSRLPVLFSPAPVDRRP